MEFLASNLRAAVRREVLNGREYLVAPMSLLTPGIHHGSKGRLKYTEVELRRNVYAWDYMPILLEHPKDGMSGRRAKVLQNQQLGFLLNTVYDGRLRSEGWFDVELVSQKAPALLPMLYAGSKVELSTGLFTDELPPDAEDHDNIATNYRPDHLAILLDNVGACSVYAGCGVFNVDEYTQEEWDEEFAEAIAANAVPSKMLDMSPEKACTILKDGAVHGKPLTERQRGMFGAKCGQRPKGNSMFDRAKAVAFITTNCRCWAAPEDKALLEKFTDEKLKGILEDVEQGAAAKATANAATEAFKKKHGRDPADGELAAAIAADPKPVPPKTLSEFEASMPPEARETWEIAKAQEARVREGVVAQLKAVAEKAPEAKKQQILATINSNPKTKQLQEMLVLVSDGVEPAPAMLGSWTPPPAKPRAAYNQEEYLGLPTTDDYV